MTDKDTDDNYSSCKTPIRKHFILVDQSGEPVANADSILGKRAADLEGLAYDPNKRLLTLPGGMELHPRMRTECAMATIYGICKRNDMQMLVQFFRLQNIALGDVGNNYSLSDRAIAVALECRAWDVLRGLCEHLCTCASVGLCASRCRRKQNVLLRHVMPALQRFIAVDDDDAVKNVLKIIKFDMADMRSFDWTSVDIMQSNACVKLLDNRYRCMRLTGKKGLSLANAATNTIMWHVNRGLATTGSWDYHTLSDEGPFGIKKDSSCAKKIVFLRFLCIMGPSWKQYSTSMPPVFFRRFADQQSAEAVDRITKIRGAISALFKQHTYYVGLHYDRPDLSHPMINTVKSSHWHTVAYMAMSGNKRYLYALYWLGLTTIVAEIIHDSRPGEYSSTTAIIACPFHRCVRLGGQDFWRMYSTGVCLSWMAVRSPVPSTPESIEPFVVTDMSDRMYATWRAYASRFCLNGGQRLLDMWISNPHMLFDCDTRSSASQCVRVVWQVLVMNHGQSSVRLFPIAVEVVMEIFKSLWVMFLSSCTCGEESFKRGACVF